MPEEKVKSGFIVLLGAANVGKSTLLNQIAGRKLSIVTSKPQTTRQNIIAISESKNHQAVFIDSAGIVSPSYKLQKFMVTRSVAAAKDEADLICLVTDGYEPEEIKSEIIEQLKKIDKPIFLIINKSDIISPERCLKIENSFKEHLNFKNVFKVSALAGAGVKDFLKAIINFLPVQERFYPKGQWTDRWERFYVGEFIREKIFELYKQEIPYSCTVEITEFKERTDDNFIKAFIYIERQSQKPIILGKGARNIRILRERSQKEIEKFLGKKIILSIEVKVIKDWRNDTVMLKKLGF